MNDLIRPSLYKAFHQIVKVNVDDVTNDASIVDVQAVQAHNVDVSATASSSVATKSSDGSTANSMPGPSIDPRRDFDIVGKHLLERVDVRTPI